MAEIISIHRSIITPVEQIGDGLFSGGVHESDGRFVEFAKHIRWGGGVEHGGKDLTSFAPSDHGLLPKGIYGGIFFNHFGHFLTESLGRLWPVNSDEFKTLPIYVHSLWGDIDLVNEESYHVITLKALGIDPNRIHIIRKDGIIECLLIPQILHWYETQGAITPAFIDFLENSQKYIEARLGDMAAFPKKIYVSRTRWQAARGIVVGETDFETFLTNNGYTAIYPETLSFYCQLQHYAAADSIIFAEGSAMHGCIMLPRLRAKVALIRRRGDGAKNVIKCSNFGFLNEIFVIQQVEKHLPFGMPDWSGVSYVDYENVSRVLVEYGFSDAVFEKWHSIQPWAEKTAVSKFCKSAADYPQFISFLIKVGAS